MEQVLEKFGSLDRESIIVDEKVSDGDTIGSLKVVHTPGHTPGHISLYAEQDKVIFGADIFFKSVYGIDGTVYSAFYGVY